MQHTTDECEFGCRGACLYQIEFIPQGDQVMLDGHDLEGFCNFVCQFVSIDCPRADKCIEQPCANIALCGNRAPQWSGLSRRSVPAVRHDVRARL
jgi:hypothetical protein